MSFKIGSIFGTKSATKNRITVSTMVGITETGKREVSRNTSEGVVFDVIAPLDDRSPQTISSLMKETGYNYEQILPTIELAEKQRYIEIFGRD
jgi:hypothetical protein